MPKCNKMSGFLLRAHVSLAATSLGTRAPNRLIFETRKVIFVCCEFNRISCDSVYRSAGSFIWQFEWATWNASNEQHLITTHIVIIIKSSIIHSHGGPTHTSSAHNAHIQSYFLCFLFAFCLVFILLSWIKEENWQSWRRARMDDGSKWSTSF